LTRSGNSSPVGPSVPTPSRFERIGTAWRTDIHDVGNEPRVLSAVAFLTTFVLARLVTHFLFATSGGGGIVVGSLHIHHMVFGLVLILASGALDTSGILRRTRAVLFGVGAALVLDEFALILNLADVYWAPQGRESIDAVVIFATVLWILVLGGNFWRKAWTELRRSERAVIHQG
jgi:hypothetical protein